MKHLLFLLLILSLAGSGIAQTSYISRKEMTKETERKWKRLLNLSETQYASLKKINREFLQRTRDIRMSLRLSYDDRMRELKLLERERTTVLQSLLSEEQRRKLGRIRGGGSREL